MSPVDVEEIFAAAPNRSYRLILSSGDHLMIRQTDEVRIQSNVISVFTPLAPGRIVGRYRYISTVNIAVLEPVEIADLPGSASNN